MLGMTFATLTAGCLAQGGLAALGVPAWVIVAAAVAAVAGIAIALYNRLVGLDVRCDNAWSDIDVQLKRRHDLIPNLVDLVGQYATYEKGTLEAVIAARGRAMGAGGPQEAAAAENALSGTLKSLFALAEAYPQLKASEQFASLQQQLSSIEDALQSARRYFNACVRDLNAAVRMFPGNVVAALGGFRGREFFELSADAERAVPGVTPR
jgi:LemA protein